MVPRVVDIHEIIQGLYEQLALKHPGRDYYSDESGFPYIVIIKAAQEAFDYSITVYDRKGCDSDCPSIEDRILSVTFDPDFDKAIFRIYEPDKWHRAWEVARTISDCYMNGVGVVRVIRGLSNGEKAIIYDEKDGTTGI